MRGLLYIFLLVGSLLSLTHCHKKAGLFPPPEQVNTNKLSYGDSIFYLQKNDYSINPLRVKSGTYTAFPDNLTIDQSTGRVTICLKGKDGESQTGSWYKIIHWSKKGVATDSTYLLISGLTYLDQFYRLNQNDSIIYPVYNGDPDNALPAGDYDLAGYQKFAIDPANGQINIRECLRRGFFNVNGTNTNWRIATVKYALHDKSNLATNKIDIILYYYQQLADVPSNVSALMQAHQQMTVGFRTLPIIPSTFGAFDNHLPKILSLTKPRPPCVIIVGN